MAPLSSASYHPSRACGQIASCTPNIIPQEGRRASGGRILALRLCRPPEMGAWRIYWHLQAFTGVLLEPVWGPASAQKGSAALPRGPTGALCPSTCQPKAQNKPSIALRLVLRCNPYAYYMIGRHHLTRAGGLGGVGLPRGPVGVRPRPVGLEALVLAELVGWSGRGSAGRRSGWRTCLGRCGPRRACAP